MMAFVPPCCRGLARPASEGAGEGARFRIAERRSYLGEWHLGVLQQLTCNLEPDLVRNCPVAHATALQPTAQGAPVHCEQMGNVIGRTVVAGQPRAQQPPNIVREFGALLALELL